MSDGAFGSDPVIEGNLLCNEDLRDGEGTSVQTQDDNLPASRIGEGWSSQLPASGRLIRNLLPDERGTWSQGEHFRIGVADTAPFLNRSTTLPPYLPQMLHICRAEDGQIFQVR